MDAIKPYLEPTTAGRSTLWAQATARRLECHVTVGYPEITPTGERYNSTVTVGPTGEVLVNYRKTFLYYTDLTWANEGAAGFYHGPLGSLGNACLGICMDINSHPERPRPDDYEFAKHCVKTGANLVVLSNAWITEHGFEELEKDATLPDMDTMEYWITRLIPLLQATGDGRDITVVIANRSGSDPAEIESPYTRKDAQGGLRVPFAGSSNIMRMTGGKIFLHDLAGQNEEKLVLVDTSKEPEKLLAQISVE